ncbi:MAG: Periplasmic oligopeptide-binding protein precursor [Fibrobacterota bacterium]|jgi:oligopeptide transport system substrate-binding protein
MRIPGRVLGIGLLALLGACTPDPSRSATVLKIANPAEPASLDPALVAGVPEVRVVSALFEGLTSLSGDSVVPCHARGWDISPDGLIWTFHLALHRWSDGTQVTASEYVWAWNRATVPALGAAYADLFDCMLGAKERRKDGITPLGARAPDDSTLVVTLAHPVPFLPLLLAQPVTFPVPRRAVERFGSRWTRPEHILTNGPYRLAWWKPWRSILAVARQDRGEKAGIDSLLFLPVEDALTAWQMSRAGQVDWLFQLPLSRLKPAQARPGFHSTPQFGTYFFRINVTRKPFDDVRVRQALQAAMPREDLVRYVTSAGELPARRLVPAIGTYPRSDSVRTDFVTARRLLREAGFPGGQGFPRFEILFNSLDLHRRIAEVVARTWHDSLGLDVGLLNYEWKSYLEAMKGLDYAVARGAWVGDYLDPQTFLDVFRSTSGNNRTGWKNAGFDSLLDLSVKSQGQERLEILKQAEGRLLEDAALIPVYFYRNLEWRNPRIEGIVENPMGLYDWTRARWRQP